MRKSIYAIHVILVVVFAFTGPINSLWANPMENEKVSAEKKENHPMVMSPEKTLRIYLEAFISRDVDTVMAYYIDHESEKIKKWRERMRALTLQCMSDRRHVKSIIDIKFLKFKDVKKGKEALFEVIIETTPKFSGAVKKDAKGRYTVTHTWVFWQIKEKGPWFFNGGGF